MCKPAVAGDRCDEGCQDGFFALSSSGCTECDCNPLGSQHSVCNKTSGQCVCYEGVTGLSCDQCDAGFFGFGVHGVGCTQCICSGHTSECTLADVTQIRSEEFIVSNFDGGDHDDWTSVTSGGVTNNVGSFSTSG